MAGYGASKMSSGQLWCCARENQNSIEESVHRNILDEISRLQIPGFEDTKTSIIHASGGRAFYRGLARNITSLKSTLSGVDVLWIEEGEDISESTLRVLTASVRLNATDSQRLLKGEDVKMPEIIITMNRGRRDGAIAKKWLARAEPELARCGYYEDDILMVVQMNYTDIPRSWFVASGLEEERLDDKEKLSHAAYEHKWHGKYLDEVDNSIIKPEWFDAAIDAHKLERFKSAFEPKGVIIAAHDPSGGGADAAGYALRHGSVIKKVSALSGEEVDVCFDWASAKAKGDAADWFIWDGDGLGGGLKRQASLAFDGTRTDYHMFRGSLQGVGQDNANQIYQKGFGKENSNHKTYAETFKNNRAQYYLMLRDRFYNTYRAVVKGHYIDPDEMISIDSNGVDDMDTLRSQACSIPLLDNKTPLQLMAKNDMKRLGISSPNEMDSVMMTLFSPPVQDALEPINYQQEHFV